MTTRDSRLHGNDSFWDKRIKTTWDYHLFGNDMFWDREAMTNTIDE